MVNIWLKKWSNIPLLPLMYWTIRLISVIYKLFHWWFKIGKIYVWYNYFVIFFLETVLCLLRYWIIRPMARAHLMSQYGHCSPNPNYHREQHFFANSSYRVLHTASQNDLFLTLVRNILINYQVVILFTLQV